MNSQSGSGSSSGQTSYVPQVNPYQIQQNAVSGAGYGAYGSAAGNAISGGESLFNQSLPGATYAAQNVAGYGSQMQNVLGTGGEQNFNVGSQGLQNLFSPDYEQKQIAASQIPGQLQYQQNLASQQAGFGGAGQLGSARQALAGTQLAQTNALQQQKAAADMQNQIAQNRMSAANSLMSGGQSALQGGLAGAQAGQAASMVPMQMAQQYAQYLNSFAPNLQGNFSGTGGYTTTTQGGTGTSSGGVNILPGLSDINAKENIEFVGTKGQHKLYDFNYRGHPERYRGVMAQDVQKYMPQAVTVSPEGYLVVDYDLLGVQMIELGK
jgi:hypothetical protein